jgi:pimeloyl-ACP methyl ester carboxylesterase
MKTLASSVAAALAFAFAFVASPASAEPGAPNALIAADLESPPIAYTLGEGAPKSTVIFMHGLGGSPKGYSDLIRALLTPPPGSPAVRVVSIWMRPKQGLHTMTDQLARARRAIDAEAGPVVLMGHSFGGKAAVKLAAEYPEAKVKGVVALAPSVNMLQSYWKRITGERALPEAGVVDAKLEQVQKALTRNLAVAQARGDKELIEDAEGQLEYALTMRDLAKHDEAGSETTVKRPTLVLHGTDDEAVSIHYARRFAAANQGAVEMVELPGANHGFRHLEDRKLDVASTMMRKPVQEFLVKQGLTGRPQLAAPAAPKLAEPTKHVGLVGRTFGK